MSAHVQLLRERNADAIERGVASIRVVLADDHAMMRRCLRLLLDGEDDLEVVAEAADVASVVRHSDSHSQQVVVLDIGMPGGCSIDAIGRLRERVPQPQIVVLTTDESPVLAKRALAAGATGYVVKELVDDELPRAVRAAASGARFVSARVSARLDALCSSLAEDKLTPREAEVLHLVALGHTTVEIAHKLHLSPRTVETHRARIHSRLGLRTRAELVHYALRRGMLSA